MARRNEHSQEEIKEMVLDAAETIIINEGYSKLTVRRIAMDIGYTVASIYMVFANMADLVTHLKSSAMDELTEQLRSANNKAPETQLIEMAKIYCRFAAKNYNRWSLIFKQPAETPEWYRVKIDTFFNLPIPLFTALLPGSTPDQCKQAAHALFSGIHGICSLNLHRDVTPEDIEATECTAILLTSGFIDGWANRK